MAIKHTQEYIEGQYKKIKNGTHKSGSITNHGDYDGDEIVTFYDDDCDSEPHQYRKDKEGIWQRIPHINTDE